MAKAAVVESPSQSAALERATSGPKRLAEFLQDTRQEMRKVVTPTREEVRTNTIIVIATVFLFAAYFGLVDYLVGHAMDLVFKHLAK